MKTNSKPPQPRKIRTLLLIIATSLVGISCSPNVIDDSFDEAAQSDFQARSSYDVNRFRADKLVCDPFGGGGVVKLEAGILAELFYRGEGQPRWYQASDYITQGKKADVQMVFSSINVPTRRFELGFPSETGQTLKNDQGEDLHEYFGLRFRSQIRLSESDPAGHYQLALLSDDGSVWKVADDSGALHRVVENDGDHPTRFGCGANTIEMKTGEARSFEIEYYQGPRYHISLIPMWRKVAEPGANLDEECGKSGNSRYFDFANNSAPQAAYQGLIARGWRPLHPGNYIFEAQDDYNPCTDSTKPTITDLAFENDPIQGPFLTWKTDKPTTSQALIVVKGESAARITQSDNILRTEHRVSLDPLESGQTYQLRGISVSENMARAISETLEVKYIQPLL